MFLTENSLFTTQAERDALVGDKRTIANLFYLNFLGFLGLVKIDDKKGAMVSYLASEKKLRPATIDATNNDASLVIKLALDAGIIRNVAAIQATKLLVLIKQKRVTSVSMDEKAIRDILEACRIQTNRPDQRIYNIVQEFIDGKTDLARTTAALYKVSRLPDYTKMTDEWRDLITRGGYTGQLIKLQSAAAGITQTPAAAPTTAARQIVLGRTNSNSMPPQNAQNGPDADYMHCLLHMFKMRTAGQGYLERFGFKASFDEKRFIEFVKRPDFILPDNPHITSWDKHPFALWIKKRSQAAFNAFVDAAANAKTGGTVPQTMSSPAVTQTTIAPPAPVSRPAPVQAVKVEMITQQAVQDLISAQSPTGVHSLMRQYNWTPATFTKHMDKFTTLVKQCTPAVNVANLRFQLGILGNFFPRKSSFFDAYVGTVFNNWSQLFNPSPLQVKNNLHLLASVLSEFLFDPQSPVTNYFVKTIVETHRTLHREQILNRVNDGFYRTILRPVEHSSILTAFHWSAWNRYLVENDWTGTEGSLFAWMFDLDTFKRVQMNQIVPLLYPANKWYKEGTRYILDIDVTVEALGLKVTDLQWVTGSNLVFETISDTSTRALTKRIIELIEVERWGNVNGDQFDELVKAIVDVYKLDPATNLFSSKYTSVFMSDRFYDRLKDKLPQDTLKMLLKDIARKPNLMTVTMWLDYLPILIENTGTDGTTHEFWSGILKHFKTIYSTRSTELYNLAVKAMIESKDVSAIFNDDSLSITFDHVSRAVHGEVGIWADAMRYLPYNRSCSPNQNLAETANLMRKYKDANGLPPITEVTPARIVGATNNAYDKLMSVTYIEPSDSRWSEVIRAMDDITTGQMIPMYGNETRMGSNWVKVYRIFNPQFYLEFAKRFKAKAGITDMNHVVDYALITPDKVSANAAIENFIDNVDGDYFDVILEKYNARMISMLKMTREIDDNKGKLTFKVLKRMLSNVTIMKVGGMYKPALDSLIEVVTDNIVTMHENGHINEANELFSLVPNGTRNAIIKSVGEVEYMNRIKDSLYKHDIKPDIDLTPDRMRTVLKYNSLKVKIPSGKKAISKIEDIKPQAHKISAAVEDLKVKDIPSTPEQLESISVELDKLGNNKHGDFKMKVLKRWDVDFPGSKERIEAFKSSRPSGVVMPRVFHGTGTVAASMILRNGFTIIPGKDESAVGRALGNGIYFTDVINKAAQYMAESGYARKYGTRGYLLEMEAALGDKIKEHRSAGFKGSTDESRGFLSPEYSVFDPLNQLRIYRVYYVEVISPKYFSEIEARVGKALNENTRAPIMNFDDYLTENVVSPGKETSIITFMDGSIATMKNTAIEWGDYKVPRGVSLMHTPEGPALQIEHSSDIEPVIIKVPSTVNWMIEQPEQYEMFKQLMAG